MHIIHLIDSSEASGGSLALLAGLIGGDAKSRHTAVVLGPVELTRRVERAGLTVAERLPDPPRGGLHFGKWLRIGRGLRRLGACDLVHCTSVRGCDVASSMLRDSPRVVTLSRELNELTKYDGESLRCPMTAFMALHPATVERLLEAGVGAGRIVLAQPAVDATRIVREPRAATRLTWGVSDEATQIFAVMGDFPPGVDALEAVLAAGLAREAGRNLRLLIGPGAPGLHRARHMLKGVGREEFLIVDERLDRPWEVLGACDAALVLSGGLGAAWAMAAGLPIVAPNTESVRHALCDQRTALLAEPGLVGQIARRVCQLMDDPARAARLAAAAQADAGERYDPAQLTRKWKTLCREVAETEGD